MTERDGAIRISIRSNPEHLPVVRGAVEQLCRVIGFGDECGAMAVSAVDEALANIITHAYDGAGDRPIEVTLRPLGGEDERAGLEVEVADEGRVVEAEAIHGRDLNDVRPGGLGTHIMGCCMDVVEYTHPAAGGTRLRMVKYLADADGAPE